MKPALYKTGLISIAVNRTTPDTVEAKHHQNIDGFCGSEMGTGLGQWFVFALPSLLASQAPMARD